MPVDPNAEIEISAFNWVPDFARGFVRDLRARWALEELGLHYRVRLLDAMKERPNEYLAEQPFGQVPIYSEGAIRLFESGAIVLHIGEKDERLLPREPAARARAVAWTFAALNSIEPIVGELANIDIFSDGAEWGKLRRPGLVEALDGRLAQLAAALDENDWLEDRFTAGDLMMVTVLRDLPDDVSSRHERLLAYRQRGEARPAFQSALAAQLADFTENEPT